MIKIFVYGWFKVNLYLIYILYINIYVINFMWLIYRIKKFEVLFGGKGVN